MNPPIPGLCRGFLLPQNQPTTHRKTGYAYFFPATPTCPPSSLATGFFSGPHPKSKLLTVSHAMNMALSGGLFFVRAFVSPLRPLKQMILNCGVGLGIHEYAVGLGMSHGAACRLFAIGAACIGILVVDTEAAISFSNPIRRVSVSNNRGGSQMIPSSGQGRFHESVRTDWLEDWGGTLSAVSTQDSMVELTRISARGSSYSGCDEFEYLGTSPLFQNSESYFEVDFTLDEVGTLYLKGLLRISGDFQGTNADYPAVNVNIADSGGEFYKRYLDISVYSYQNESLNIDEVFSLQPGNYKFTIKATTAGFYFPAENYQSIGGGGIASYDLTLVPEPSQMALGVLGGLLFVARRRRTAGTSAG